MPLRLKARSSKYRAIPTEIEGIRFASRKEARYYQHLRMLELAGQVQDIERQPVFPIVVNGRTICTYVADFQYVDRQSGEVVTVDVKGLHTPVYRLKKKLVEALYPVQIVEV